MRFLAIVLLAVVIGAFMWGTFDLILLCQGTPEPEAVTLEQLGRLDGTKNVHLTISDFEFGNGLFQEEGKNEVDRRLWIPLLNREGKWTPRPVVAWIGGTVDQAKLDQISARPVLTGVVSNSVQSVGPYQREKLNKVYPDQDFSNSLAFNIDREFPTMAKVVTRFVIGILSLIVSIVLLIREIKSVTPQTPAYDAEVESKPTES